MSARIRPTSVWATGIGKVGDITDGTFSFMTDGESVVTEQGWRGVTEGAIHGKISLNAVQVVGGNASLRALKRAFLGQTYLKIKLEVFGDNATVDAKVVSIGGNWKYQGGSFTGSLELECGKPS
jgi:hypothetical protein